MENIEEIRKFKHAVAGTEVLLVPRRGIATFGPTMFSYWCLSALGKTSTRARSGTVYAEKPQIILPGRLRELFEGFAAEARDAAQELFHQLGDQLRALGYHFRHEPKTAKTLERPFKDAFKEVADKLKEETLTGVVRGPDKYWEISVLKFTLDMAAQSFPVNVADLERRNLFGPEGQLRAQVEAFFYKAGRSPETIPDLAEFLKQNKIFEEYEDRFFDLVQKKNTAG
ncbi:MAG: hypothetical protein HY747_09625 [Elusimicrobia bacterium]|nr:hypothetical protein [Elusimicrobiota bacterium]